MNGILILASCLALHAAPPEPSAQSDSRVSGVIRLDSIGFKHMTYRVATGERIPGRPFHPERYGDVIWQNQAVPYFYGISNCDDPPHNYSELLLDWAGLPANSFVDGIGIAYGTDAATGPNSVTMWFAYLNNSTGWGDSEFPPVAGFIVDLPGRPAGWPYQFVGWFVTLDLEGSGAEFCLGDQDNNNDGLADFAYTFGVIGARDATASGPIIAGWGPGAEDAFDLYSPAPPHECIDPDIPYIYDWTYYSTSPPYRQFFLVLYGASGGCPFCPGGDACVAGDVDGDCAVTLADLSALLAAFGCVDGQACYNPAADFDNSGDVGLMDLSSLLGVYGLNCN